MTRVTFCETVIASHVCRYSVNHFWAGTCATHYEGQTTTSAFHRL